MPNDEEPAVVPLTEPSEGVPEVTTTEEMLAEAVAALENGSGPVAVDAERASGYRYGQSTYLVQLRRNGSGTWLIDPTTLPDLSSLSAVLEGTEWVLHAASQDLHGLAEQNLHPDVLFDTELAARLLGMPRVGLAAVVADTLGLGLAKEHSAVDWSTRPLPESWLRYAALDVEVLAEVRDVLAARLEAADKMGWALQEFEAVRTAAPPVPRVDPWRRVSGMHVLRQRRELAVVKELWQTREDDARRRNISPGRVLPDAAIVAAAQAKPRTEEALVALKSFSGKGTRRRAGQWFVAVQRALDADENGLPPMRGPGVPGPPPPRSWADRDPQAWARLSAAKHLIAEVSEAHNVPAENVLQPDLLRRVCWSPPDPISVEALSEAFTAGGARPWQVELIAAPLAQALARLP